MSEKSNTTHKPKTAVPASVDPAPAVLPGENLRGEVAGCPTGLNEGLPPQPPPQPPGDMPGETEHLEVEQLEGRQGDTEPPVSKTV